MPEPEVINDAEWGVIQGIIASDHKFLNGDMVRHWMKKLVERVVHLNEKIINMRNTMIQGKLVSLKSVGREGLEVFVDTGDAATAGTYRIVPEAKLRIDHGPVDAEYNSEAILQQWFGKSADQAWSVEFTTLADDDRKIGEATFEVN